MHMCKEFKETGFFAPDRFSKHRFAQSSPHGKLKMPIFNSANKLTDTSNRRLVVNGL